MFNRALKVLVSKNVNFTFEIQICGYRNWNSSIPNLFEHSSWNSNPNNLKQYLDNLHAKDGGGNEAIEVALFYANKLIKDHDNFDQIIIIGDAEPNTKIEFANRKGPNWNSTEYNNCRYYEDELNDLINNKKVIHTFYVAARAKKKFEEIASKTKGNCEELDINSDKGAERLTNLVTTEILGSIQNITGIDLKKEYIKMFMS
jgi:hypothetical protein